MPGVHQKTISRDLDSDDDAAFQAGVRTLFRSALDVFLMGEVRDVATGRVVRAVLESGHSALTTTHAASALGIYTKYASPQVGIPLDVLGTPGLLKLNVYQALLAKNCRCALAPDDLAQDLDAQARAQQAQLLDDIQALYGIQAHALRMRNPQGCEHCRRSDLSALWGYAGRTVVAEMVEPDEVMCELILKGEMVRLRRHWRSLSDGDITSGNLTGKTAMEVAMFKAAQGLIDPREVQQHFDSFRSLASKAQAERQLSQRRAAARVTPLAPVLASHSANVRSATASTVCTVASGASSGQPAETAQPELEAGVGT
jgi:type II secretory ATPase GspE/PulE/Tfp pilus assembly ATPase PilB-like protein